MAKKTRAELLAMARKGGEATRRKHPNQLKEMAPMGGRATKGIRKKRRAKTYVEAIDELLPPATRKEQVERAFAQRDRILAELNA